MVRDPEKSFRGWHLGLALAVLGYGALTSGCVGVFKQQGYKIKVSPISEEYKLKESLQGKAYVNLGESSTGQERYRSSISNNLVEVLQKYDKDSDLVNLTVLSFSDLTNKLNEKKLLAEKYATIMDFHQKYGMFKREDLNFLQDNLEADYIFQPVLIDFRQSDKTRASVFGLKLINTQVGNIKLVLELWNMEKGHKVFETTCELYGAEESILEKPILLEEILRKSLTKMVEKLPKG